MPQAGQGSLAGGVSVFCILPFSACGLTWSWSFFVQEAVVVWMAMPTSIAPNRDFEIFILFRIMVKNLCVYYIDECSGNNARGRIKNTRIPVDAAYTHFPHEQFADKV